jgi:hypothetical protein
LTNFQQQFDQDEKADLHAKYMTLIQAVHTKFGTRQVGPFGVYPQ